MITEAMWEAANTISVVVDMFVSAILVTWFYMPYVNKRYQAVFSGTAYFLVMTFLYYIPFTFPMSGTMAYVIGAASVCTVSVLTDRRNIPQKVFLSFMIYMLLWSSRVTALLPWEPVSKATYLNPAVSDATKQLMLFALALALLVLTENVLFFAEILIVRKIYVWKKERMAWRELPLLCSPYIAIMAGYWISSFMSDAYVVVSGKYIGDSYPVYDVIRAVYGMMAFIAAITVLYSYQQIKQSQEEALQNALVARQMEELNDHVHTMEKLYADIRGIRHDINDHIMILGNLLDKGRADDAATYLNEWKEGFPMPEIHARTGNPVTDIILSEKKREAEEAGISFSEDFHYPTDSNAESTDIGIILTNALSNAIRAAKTSDTPQVEIKSWLTRRTFFIEVRNTYAGKLPPLSESGYPETSRPDKDHHGYGLTNMKRIAEKYYGTIQLEQADRIVILTVMLMIA